MQETVELGYRPKRGGVADFAILPGKDGYHLFHDHVIPGNKRQSQKHLGHAFSEDLVHWEEKEGVLKTVNGTWEGKALYSPTIIFHKNLYYMFYVGVSENHVQRIGSATSEDLWHWTKFIDNPVWDPGGTRWANWYRGVPQKNRHGSCRDLAIIFISGDYLLYYTSRCRDNSCCIAACETFDDTFNWYDRGPVLVRKVLLEGTGETESPHVIFKPEFSKYYLFFNHGLGIKCVWSSDPLDFNKSKEIMFLKGCNGFEYLGKRGKHEYFAYFTSKFKFTIGEIKWCNKKPEFSPVKNVKLLKKFAVYNIVHWKNKDLFSMFLNNVGVGMAIR